MSELQKQKARLSAVIARATRAKNIPPLAVRFWSKVDKRGPDECWPWQAAPRKKSEGYGAFWLDGRHQPATRVAWILTNGEFPKGKQVLHHCDNPPCCNPAHLFLGTNLENNADKVAKNRHVYGSRNPNAKLTEQQVVEIKRLKPVGTTPRGYRGEIAERYNVKPGTITDIWIRSWTHLN